MSGLATSTRPSRRTVNLRSRRRSSRFSASLAARSCSACCLASSSAHCLSASAAAAAASASLHGVAEDQGMHDSCLNHEMQQPLPPCSAVMKMAAHSTCSMYSAQRSANALRCLGSVCCGWDKGELSPDVASMKVFHASFLLY